MTDYSLTDVDRQNLASAKLQGIMTDLNMTTQQFATAVSILFVGYLPYQIVSNVLISRISRPGLCESWNYLTSIIQDWYLTLSFRYLRCLCHLGCPQRLHSRRQILRCPPRCPYHARFRRSRFLPGCYLSPIRLVHQERTW